MFATAQTIIHFNFTILSPYLYSLGSRMTTDKPDDIPLIPDTLLIKTNVLLLALGETDQRISGLKLQLASVESSRVKLTLEVGRAEDDNMSVLMNKRGGRLAPPATTSSNHRHTSPLVRSVSVTAPVQTAWSINRRNSSPRFLEVRRLNRKVNSSKYACK